MISEEQREESLDYLIETDQAYAHARGLLSGLEKQEKTILSIEALESSEKTQGMREHDARVSPNYKQWHEKYRTAVYNYELLKNKRITHTLVVEVWRSELSARKQGMIV